MKRKKLKRKLSSYSDYQNINLNKEEDQIIEEEYTKYKTKAKHNRKNNKNSDKI